MTINYKIISTMLVTICLQGLVNYAIGDENNDIIVIAGKADGIRHLKATKLAIEAFPKSKRYVNIGTTNKMKEAWNDEFHSTDELNFLERPKQAIQMFDPVRNHKENSPVIFMTGHGFSPRVESNPRTAGLQSIFKNGETALNNKVLGNLIGKKLDNTKYNRIIATQCYSGSIHNISFDFENVCSLSSTDWKSPSIVTQKDNINLYVKGILIEKQSSNLGLNSNGKMNLIDAHIAGILTDYKNDSKQSPSSIAYVDYILGEGPYLNFDSQISSRKNCNKNSNQSSGGVSSLTKLFENITKMSQGSSRKELALSPIEFSRLDNLSQDLYLKLKKNKKINKMLSYCPSLVFKQTKEDSLEKEINELVKQKKLYDVETEEISSRLLESKNEFINNFLEMKPNLNSLSKNIDLIQFLTKIKIQTPSISEELISTKISKFFERKVNANKILISDLESKKAAFTDQFEYLQNELQSSQYYNNIKESFDEARKLSDKSSSILVSIKNKYEELSELKLGFTKNFDEDKSIRICRNLNTFIEKMRKRSYFFKKASIDQVNKLNSLIRCENEPL